MSSASRFWSRSTTRRAACVAGLVLLGCGPANENDDRYWKPASDLGGISLLQNDAGAGGAGGAGGSGGQANPPPTGSVTFTVTTSSFGGRYAPRNVGAIWVETKGGQFVRTLTEWGRFRSGNLVKWGAEANYNKVDAVTSATAFSATTHKGKWDYTDLGGQGMPDGQYKFIVEFTEDDSAVSFISPGPWKAVPFTKGPNVKDFTVPDGQYFKSMSVTYSQK